MISPHILLSIPSVIFIALLSVFLNSIFVNKFHLDRLHSFLSSLLVAPFILSLLLYTLFFIFPDKPDSFYVWFLFLTPCICLFSQRKYIQNTRIDVRSLFYRLRNIRLNFISKVFAILIFFILILCFLRVFFWPINWTDQIYYIEQSYAIGQQKSLSIFFHPDFFDNGILKFQIDAAIRPGLPLLYATAALFSASLETVVQYAQIMTFYFLAVALGIFFLITKRISRTNVAEKSLLTVLLILSTYLFINLAVLGFKELPMLCFILLIFDVLSKPTYHPTKSNSIYIGVLMGMMSYINLSGSLLSCIIILIIFFLFPKLSFIKRSLLTARSLIILVLVSGFEFPYFFEWIIPGYSTVRNNILTLLHQSAQTIGIYIPYIQSEYISPVFREFTSYKISSGIDQYTKGKLQGFFQPEFYGLIFPLFLTVLIFRFRQLIANNYIKLLLIFIALYYLILIDIFGLNHHEYSYILTASHKYTVMLIPFIALVIGSQWFWIKHILKLLRLHILVMISSVALIASIFYIDRNYNNILNVLRLFMPMYNSNQYYVDVLKLANHSFIVVISILLTAIAFFFLLFRKKLSEFWNKNSMGAIVVLIALFYLPSLFFFNTNFGLADTLTLSFRSKEIKLAHINGWGNSYFMVNVLNRLPARSNILFVNQGFQLMEIHLNFPSKFIFLLPDKNTLTVTTDAIQQAVKKNNIQYIITKNGAFDLPEKNILYSTDTLSLYRSNFSQ